MLPDDTALKAIYEDTIRQYEFPEGWQQSREFGLDLMRRALGIGYRNATVYALSAPHCIRQEGCVCGGDLPGVRQSCAFWSGGSSK